MKLATAFVELRADRSKLKRDLDGVAADTRGSADSAGKMFAQVFGAAAFGAGIKKSIDAASDLNETISKTKVLFGADADAVIAFGATTAKAMGMSQRAYLDAAAGLKGLLDNLGLAPDLATEWSQKLTALGSDLGSFFNKDPAEAVAAIGSAMRGESEPIRAFNVQINEAAIKAKALELGLYDGVGAIDSSAKAQATLALIMEQTTAAQGDFARTADGAANSQRIAAATMEDSAASLGQAFLPIYTKIVQVVTALVKGFGELPAPVQVALVALAGLVALSGPIHTVTDMAKSLTKVIRELGPNAQSAGVGVGVFATVALVGLALHAKAAADRANEVAEAISEISRATSDKAAVEEFWKFLTTNVLTGDDAMKKLAETNLEGAKRILAIGSASGLTAEGLDALRGAIEAEDAALAAAAETHEKYGGAVVATGAALDGERHALDQAKGHVDAMKAAQEAATAAEEANKTATDELNDSIDDSTTAFSAAADAADELRSAIDAVFGGTVNMEEANRNLQAEIDATTASIKDNGKTLDITTEKGRANREQIEKQANAIIDYGVALVGSGKSNKEASDAIAFGTEQLKLQLTAAGMSREAVDAYIATLGLTPENVTTAIKLADDEAAKTRLGEIVAQLGDIDAGAAAKIEALIEEGKFAEAEARLREIAKAKNITLNLVAGSGLRLIFEPGTQPLLRFGGPTAEGGVFDKPQIRSISEAGREVVLPLTKPSRLAALLADPRVAGPVTAAMGAGAPGGATAGPGQLFSVGTINGSEAMRRLVETRLSELAAEIMAGRL